MLRDTAQTRCGMLSKFYRLMILVGLAAGVPAQAMDLVNGSFETAPPGNTILPGGSMAIPGWMTAGEGVEWFQSAGFGPAKDGVSVLDLAWFTSTGSPGGGIFQNLATSIGQRYSLTFYGTTLSGAGRDGTGTIDALIDDALVGTLSLSNAKAFWTAADWTEFSFEFTAASSLTKIGFRNQQNALQHFAILDGTSVTQMSPATVPEPAAWLLMIGGFGLVGAAARRSRAIQPAS